MRYLEKLNLFIKDIINDYIINISSLGRAGNIFDIPISSLGRAEKDKIFFNKINKFNKKEIYNKLFSKINYYEKFVNIYGKFPLTELSSYYVLLLNNLSSNNNIKDVYNEYINMEIYIKKIAKINIDNIINNISAITIQKAFKKYRYDPKYKFCKLVQTKNLFLIGSINNEELNNYIKEENIIIY